MTPGAAVHTGCMILLAALMAGLCSQNARGAADQKLPGRTTTMPTMPAGSAGAEVGDLPMGPAPDPVAFPHFPDRLHAYIWRNWQLVPLERLAKVVGASPPEILAVAGSMGLGDPPGITEENRERTYITVLRRNWHLLPYEQLLQLLEWTPEQMLYCLREGDGLFWWFGRYKPRLEPLRYTRPTEGARARAGEIASVVSQTFPAGVDKVDGRLFSFVDRLSRAETAHVTADAQSAFSPRFCFSYFGSFRRPLSSEKDSYPEGYLARLARAGVDGVWLHEPLYRLAPFPWDPSLSERHQECLDKLRALVARARKFGVGVYLYLNEPRPMPLAFFEKHPELKGVDDTNVISGQLATLCTSVPGVQDYIRQSVASLCRAVPNLAGVFTITASESYTNCWSHGTGARCPRCRKRSPEEVIAEVNSLIGQGIARSGSQCRLIVWDWGWRDEWVEGIIRRLPESAWLMSVSEWSTPIERGGIKSVVGEYALSVVGPGPRATRHWELARRRGLKTIAKIQASTTWELGAVPYIPVVETIATHAGNLRTAGVDGLMLSWTLGGYPSAGFEAVLEMGRDHNPTVEDTLGTVAGRRFGPKLAPAVVKAWRAFSQAFKAFPFHIGVLYRSPVHLGPANLLWPEPTGYDRKLTMGFGHPLDDLDTWRAVYPPDVFIGQLEKVADGFDQTIAALCAETRGVVAGRAEKAALASEIGVAEACAVHYRSVAHQARFVAVRNQLRRADTSDQAAPLLDVLETTLKSEVALAVRLHAIQCRDSRIGFEAACQYLYVPMDLGEKVINCRYLLSHWLPSQRKRFGR